MTANQPTPERDRPEVEEWTRDQAQGCLMVLVLAVFFGGPVFIGVLAWLMQK